MGLLTANSKPESIRVLAIFIIARMIVLCADSGEVDFNFLTRVKASGSTRTNNNGKNSSLAASKIALPPASFLHKVCGFSNYEMPAFCLCLEHWLLELPVTYAIYDALMCAVLGFNYDRGLASPGPDPTPLHFNGSEQIQNANLLFLTFRILIKKPRLMQVAMGHLNTLVAPSSLAGVCNCATIIQQYDWQIWLFNLLEELTDSRTDGEKLSANDISARSYQQRGFRENIKSIFCSLHLFAMRARPKIGLKLEDPRLWGSTPFGVHSGTMRRNGYEVFNESIILAQVLI